MQGSIDITNQEKIPYSFAQVATTNLDKKQTMHILKKVYTHIAEFITIEMRPNSVSFSSKSRRSCRIILYDLHTLLSEKNLFVVIFYANKRENLSEAFSKEFFETDWKIAMAMMGSNNILCYASQELSNGNWFNIVLFTKESDKHTVTASETHKHAAYAVAPKRFSWIRLHNAYLPQGIMQYGNIILQKTNYYHFDANWFAVRRYESIQTEKETI